MTASAQIRESLAPYEVYPLQDLLSRASSRLPDKVGVIDGDRTFSFAQLDEHSSRLAAALGDLGVSKGDRVAILAPNCAEFVIAFFGVLKAGAVATTVNTGYREREIAQTSIFLVGHGPTVLFQGGKTPVTVELQPRGRAVRRGCPDNPVPQSRERHRPAQLLLEKGLRRFGLDATTIRESRLHPGPGSFDFEQSHAEPGGEPQLIGTTLLAPSYGRPRGLAIRTHDHASEHGPGLKSGQRARMVLPRRGRSLGRNELAQRLAAREHSRTQREPQCHRALHHVRADTGR